MNILPLEYRAVKSLSRGGDPVQERCLGGIPDPRQPDRFRAQSPGDEDRALLESNPSASPGPLGPLPEMPFPSPFSSPLFPFGTPTSPSAPPWPPLPQGAKAKNSAADRREAASGLPLTHKKHLPLANLQDAYYRIDRANAAMRYRDCGQAHVVYTCSSTGEKWRSTFRCHDRLCPDCARIRALREFHKYREQLSQPGLLLVTLTVPNTWHVAREDYKALRRAFGVLRRRRPFRKAWKGGGYSIETVWSKARGFHVHLHAVIDGRYVPQALLKRNWHEITGNAYIVDVRRVDSASQALKYIMKPDSLEGMSVSLLAEFILATTSSRLFQTFGSWHGQGDKEPPPGLACPYCGHCAYTREVFPPGMCLLHVPWGYPDHDVDAWTFTPRAPPDDAP